MENEDSRAQNDILEWHYLSRVLEEFGFGPSFIGWIKTLFNAPSAKVSINNEYSGRIQLARGMRQGCPLSPSALRPRDGTIGNSN